MDTEMKQCSASTFTVRIYIAGPMEVAKQILREECLREGLCVTIEPTTFIYTGGEEVGYIVGFVNYPRFQQDSASILTRARSVMGLLLDKTFQHSALLVTPDITEWITKRHEN